MPQSHDAIYFERRRDVSLKNAKTASDRGIARVHREFAERYEQAIHSEQSQPQPG